MPSLLKKTFLCFCRRTTQEAWKKSYNLINVINGTTVNTNASVETWKGFCNLDICLPVCLFLSPSFSERLVYVCLFLWTCDRPGSVTLLCKTLTPILCYICFSSPSHISNSKIEKALCLVFITLLIVCVRVAFVKNLSCIKRTDLKTLQNIEWML